ncbi:MAG TPA: bifunctional hydroxymethylpyrimidine kinase/phosphomethylpyrimidine kinase [Pseudomonadales bacterium]|nr:bifunctional hydroxymethylpyrimidine kinase/phosphomethylpyrimidine kinase [Pseudomonadales bacterium]
MQQNNTPICVLSIAGSDTSGGAGIQADIKTISVCGAYALTAITAITAQDGEGVHGVWPVSAQQLRSQIDAGLAYKPSAIKIGMLGTAELVTVVAEAISQHPGIPVILDPVIFASSGAVLLDEDGVDTLRARLMPLATLVTPNESEARELFGNEYREVAQLWSEKTGVAVLITGGESESEYCTDVLIQGEQEEEFRSPRIETRNQRGTGCTLTSAIASFMAQQLSLTEAIHNSRGFVRRALSAAQADKWRGNGPLKHFHEFDMHRFQER